MTRSYIRLPTHPPNPRNEEIYGMIRSNETTLGSVGALTEGLTDTPDMEVTAVVQATNDELRRIAGEFLLRVRDDVDRVARTRLNYVQNARRYGMTFAEIGTHLGVTEGAVRYIAKQGDE